MLRDLQEQKQEQNQGQGRRYQVDRRPYPRFELILADYGRVRLIAQRGVNEPDGSPGVPDGYVLFWEYDSSQLDLAMSEYERVKHMPLDQLTYGVNGTEPQGWRVSVNPALPYGPNCRLRPFCDPEQEFLGPHTCKAKR